MLDETDGEGPAYWPREVQRCEMELRKAIRDGAPEEEIAKWRNFLRKAEQHLPSREAKP